MREAGEVVGPRCGWPNQATAGPDKRVGGQELQRSLPLVLEWEGRAACLGARYLKCSSAGEGQRDAGELKPGKPPGCRPW